MRREFTSKIREAAWARCAGRCEKCTAKLLPGKFQYDHDMPDGLGGEPTLENCKVLCSACHDDKTHKHDRPLMAKADRIKKKHFGIKTPSRGFDKRWKKKLSGEVVPRD